MLTLTKKTEYGLMALVHLSHNGPRVRSAREISDAREHYRISRDNRDWSIFLRFCGMNLREKTVYYYEEVSLDR